MIAYNVNECVYGKLATVKSNLIFFSFAQYSFIRVNQRAGKGLTRGHSLTLFSLANLLYFNSVDISRKN